MMMRKKIVRRALVPFAIGALFGLGAGGLHFLYEAPKWSPCVLKWPTSSFINRNTVRDCLAGALVVPLIVAGVAWAVARFRQRGEPEQREHGIGRGDVAIALAETALVGVPGVALALWAIAFARVPPGVTRSFVTPEVGAPVALIGGLFVMFLGARSVRARPAEIYPLDVFALALAGGFAGFAATLPFVAFHARWGITIG